MTEHSAAYYRAMKKNMKMEMERRRKVSFVLLSLAAFVVLLGISMLVLRILISSEHKKAVEIYNQNNWSTVEPIAGGKNIYGMSGGESFSYVDDGRYFEGISVEGVNIGGMTYTEARQTVMGIIEEHLNDISMVVPVGNACLALSASDFNVEVNAEEVLEDAYDLGRENLTDYYANYLKQQDIKAHPVDFKLEYKCDRNSIMRRVNAIAEFVNTEPVEPYITAVGRAGANTSEGEGASYAPVITDKGATYDTIYAANGVAIGYLFYHPGKDGFVLNRDSLADRIVEAFEEEDFHCVLVAELEEAYRETTVEELKASVSRLTGYTSEFKISQKNRSRNIQKAAGILNGCEVHAGEEISFNTYVGPRTEAGGWLPAPGIVNGNDYENSPGGGICQVSGTLYNALLQCGPNKIKITGRRHHSWPSEYVPYGLDATVDTTGPDLKWKNISGDSLYIFTYADLNKGVMYVYVYGVPEEDGSYYETYAETVETLEPGEPIYIDWPSYPTGYNEVIIKGRQGYRAKAYLNHFASDGTLIEQIYLYTDTYLPVTQQIRRGTGNSSMPKPNQ